MMISRTITVVLLVLAAGCRPAPRPDSSENDQRDAESALPISIPTIDVPTCEDTESAPGTEPLREEQLQTQLEKARLQMGSSFRPAIVGPFVVTGDLPAEQFEKISRTTIAWAVETLTKDFFAEEPAEVITIYLFEGRESYRKHAWSLFSDRPSTPYGYYSAQHRALVMNIATGTGTLVHEIVHPYMRTDFPLAPSWFDEGLASLFEQCRQREGHIAGLLNWRLPVLKGGLQSGKLVALEELLATSTEEFYKDPDGMHYAEARYLCYYLQEKQLLRPFYREFKSNQKVDPTGRETLLEVTGKNSLKELQDEWLEFLAPLNFVR